ncbi:MAG: cytochrome b [Proteobacteria bacterium]|nr:cytochrome b [Pseudomonadota bacterium]
MEIINTKKEFSLPTKILHWSIFILFVIQYFLVYRREYFPKDSPEKLQYILLHKSLGVILLLFALLMLVWRYVGTQPIMPKTMTLFEVKIAKLTHFFLYTMMLLQPITGILMSDLSGRQISIFNWFKMPLLFTKNESLATIFYQIHVWSSFFIIGIFCLHVLGALFHYFIRKDDVLQRMTIR